MPFRRISCALLGTLCALALLACSDETTCPHETLVSCRCPDGSTGQQTCGPSGLGACQCGSGATDMDAATPDAPDGPDAGDLSISDAGDADLQSDPPPPDATGSDAAGDADATDLGGDTGTDSTPTGPILFAQPRVALPYASAGSSVAAGDLAVFELGGDDFSGPLQVAVTGPFEVTGDLSALTANDERHLAVAYTGPTDSPALVTGSAHLSDDDQGVDVGLAAVLGAADLPQATWSDGPRDSQVTAVDLDSAPFPDGSASYTDSTVFIAVPPGLSDRPNVELVVHFHGFNAVVEETVESEHLVDLQVLSGRDAVFVAPQGPYNAADPDFGKLDQPNGLRNLARDVVSLLYRDGFIEWPEIGPTVLTSHSGGWAGTANAVSVGGLNVIAVQLYDSLYANESVFASFVENGGILRSNYTTGGGTMDNNQSLLTTLENASIPVDTTGGDGALDDTDVTIVLSPALHVDVMWHERTAARWLYASGLRRRPNAPPELLLTEAAGDQAHVRWRPDRGAVGTRWQVRGSLDGTTWETLAETTDLQATVAARPYLQVVAVDPVAGPSDPSDTYGATGSTWLVVDGFDRVLLGSYSGATHPFAAWLGVATGQGFSAASNEAVEEGLVDLSDYSNVLWELGDESVHDVTFDPTEQALLQAYVDGGGRLIVTGSEVGYATNAAFLSSALHVTFVADNAGTTHAGGYTFGVAYPEDYPDVLSGATTLWSYDTGGGAAVGWSHQVITVGFPLETIADDERAEAVQELAAWLTGP
jgi:hypothetical protein